MSEVLEQPQYRLAFNAQAATYWANEARKPPYGDLAVYYTDELNKVLSASMPLWHYFKAQAMVHAVNTSSAGDLTLDVSFNDQALWRLSGNLAGSTSYAETGVVTQADRQEAIENVDHIVRAQLGELYAYHPTMPGYNHKITITPLASTAISFEV